MNGTAPKKPARQAKPGYVLVLLSEIHPAPENDTLYRPIDPADAEIVELAKSIRVHRIMEPLILSADYFIISGHRRRAAAEIAGVRRLPCIIRSDISRAQHPEQFMRLLREANRQRVKSLDEKVREEVISANPEEAYAALIEHRKAAAAVSAETMAVGISRRRCEISAAKRPFLDAIIAVLHDRQKFWPLSDRQIHYALLNDPPLIHSKKPDSRYGNNPKSYKSLTDMLTRARLAGKIPFAAIADETRPVETWNIHRDATGFIRKEIDGLLKQYWRDLLQSQTNHIELVIEKNTLLGIIKPVAAEYTVPITSGRGYCSLAPRRGIAERFRKSGKEKLVLLMVSDFDPDGENIAESFVRSMRDDFGVVDEFGDSMIVPIKVALTAQQVKIHRLPPSMKAKAGCSTREKFVALHGDNVFEVEALPPDTLQDIVRTAIDGVLDIAAFNVELDREKQDAAELETLRHRVHAAIGSATGAH